MFGLMEVLGGVFVFRGVAATDVAALTAKSELDPSVSHFQTLFAALAMSFDVFDVT